MVSMCVYAPSLKLRSVKTLENGKKQEQDSSEESRQGKRIEGYIVEMNEVKIDVLGVE